MKPAPPAPPKKPEPPEPQGSKFERVFASVLKGQVACEKDQIFIADYGWLPGSEETVKDWKVERPPFSAGFTPKGYAIECRGKQFAKYVYKVPLAQPYSMEMTVQFETKRPETNFVLTIAEGKGGAGFGIDCGQTLFRRSRGEIVQVLRKVPNPAAEYLKAWADVSLKVFVDNDEVSVECDGKKTIDKVRIKEGNGLLGFEAANDCKVAMKNLRIKAQPDPMWLTEELKKIKD